MEAAGRVSDEWCREKFIQEADNVLMHINAQVLKNRQEFNSMSAQGGRRQRSEIQPVVRRVLIVCADELTSDLPVLTFDEKSTMATPSLPKRLHRNGEVLGNLSGRFPVFCYQKQSCRAGFKTSGRLPVGCTRSCSCRKGLRSTPRPCVRELTVPNRHISSLGSVPLDSVISRSPGRP